MIEANVNSAAHVQCNRAHLCVFCETRHNNDRGCSNSQHGCSNSQHGHKLNGILNGCSNALKNEAVAGR
eukprot:6194075-Pleurochrysis_carterae.AAC.1